MPFALSVSVCPEREAVEGSLSKEAQATTRAVKAAEQLLFIKHFLHGKHAQHLKFYQVNARSALARYLK